MKRTGRVVMSLGVPLLLLIGCAEDTEGTGGHASVEPCSIHAVAPSPGGHVAFQDGDSALMVAVPDVSPPGPLPEALTPHDVVADGLWALCPFSPRAPPRIRSF